MNVVGTEAAQLARSNTWLGFSLQCTGNILVAFYVRTQHHSATNHWKSDKNPTQGEIVDALKEAHLEKHLIVQVPIHDGPPILWLKP
jgi:hypothetical protein